MFGQLLRCLCSCVPKSKGAHRSAGPGEPQPTGETVPPDMAPLLDIEGIGPRTVQYLVEGGFTSVEQVRLASQDELAAIPGVGGRAAELLKRALDTA